MFCIFQYYPEKHDCIFRNIRLYISVWDSIFQNIKISRKIQRNIQSNLQIFRNILPVFFRIFFKNPVLYCRIFRNIPRFLRIFLVLPTGFFFLDFIILDRIFQNFSRFCSFSKNSEKYKQIFQNNIFRNIYIKFKIILYLSEYFYILYLCICQNNTRYFCIFLYSWDASNSTYMHGRNHRLFLISFAASFAYVWECMKRFWDNHMKSDISEYTRLFWNIGRY